MAETAAAWLASATLAQIAALSRFQTARCLSCGPKATPDCACWPAKMPKYLKDETMPDLLSMLPAVIRAVAPRADSAAWAAALAPDMRVSGVLTANRIAMFIGQIAEESGGFEALSEGLFYSTAARIVSEFSSEFAAENEALPYVGRPRALANRVYANRMGNGNEDSGDGWTFRGRGLIQITGRTLYEMFGRAEARAAGDPDWLLTTSGAATSACWYWTLPGARPSLNSLADEWDIEAATRRINGGETNLAARVMACDAARAVFGASAKPVASGPIPEAPPAESAADRLDDLYNAAPAGSPAPTE